MPVISYQGAKLGTADKKQLVKELTTKTVEITGTPSNFSL